MAVDALLVTKLSRPRVTSTHLDRPHVTGVLRSGLNRKLTALVAGAGHGKSSTLARFVEQSGLPYAWVQLDGEDADLITFAQYLAHAISQRLNGGNRVRGRLRSVGTAVTPGTLLPALVQDLSDCPPSIVVLDDFHIIPPDSAVAGLVRDLVAYCPPHVHLYITSRTPLPFPLARLKVQQEAAEINEADLRFTPGEVNDFFCRALKLELSDEDLRQVVHLTEGWPAALVLFAAAVNRRGSFAALRISDIPADLFHYLAEEVVTGLKPDLQAFLEETAILDTCQVEACNAILGRSDARPVLAALEGSNLMLSRLGPDTFRYHHLLQRFLHQRLEERDHGQTACNLHRRAAEWFLKQQSPEDAVRHFLKAGALDRAAGLVEELAPTWMRWNHLDRLRALLALLPTSVRQSYPWLALCDARQQYAQGEFDTALGLANLGLRAFTAAGDHRGIVQAHLLAGMVHGTRQEYEAAGAAFAAADQHLRPEFTFERATTLERKALLTYAVQGPLPEVEAQLRQAMALYTEIGDLAGEASAADILGLVRVRVGDYASAASLLERSAAILRSMGEPPYEIGINLGWAYHQMGRFQDARDIFAPMMNSSSRKVRRAYAALNLVETYTRLGEFDQAMATAQTANSLIEELGHRDAGTMLLCHLAALHRLWGKPHVARSHIKEALHQADDLRSTPRLLRIVLEAALVHVTYTGNSRAVRKLVARGLAGITGEQDRWLCNLLVAVDAVAAFRLDRSEWRAEGVRRLGECLSNCHRWGYEAMAVHEWPLMLTVALIGLAYGVEPEICTALIRRMHADLPQAVKAAGIPLADAEARLIPPAWQVLPNDSERQMLMDLLTPEDRRRIIGLATGPAPVTVRCLGPLEVEVGGTVIDYKALKRRKAGQLLTFLLCHEHAVPREVVLDSLWSDLDAGAADTSLRVAIHYLRRLLEPHLGGRGKSRYVQAEGGLVWFSRQPEVLVDVDRFRQSLEQAQCNAAEEELEAAAQDFADAVEYYRGPLAAGELYSEGLESLRRAEAIRFTGALAWLGEYYWTEGQDLPRALSYYRRLVEVDPANEEAHQALIRILLETGQVGEARRQVTLCRTALQQHLDVDPSQATLSLEQVVAGLEQEPAGENRPSPAHRRPADPDARRRQASS